MVRVVVADDHAVVREGMRIYIEETNDIECVGWAANGTEALALALDRRPDVVVLDLFMPGLDGLATTRAIRESLDDTGVVIITEFDAPTAVSEAKEAGAGAFVRKRDDPQVLLRAIRTVANRGRMRPVPGSNGHSVHRPA